MILVYIHWFLCGSSTPCVVTKTEEKAQEYIEKQMEGKINNGTGIYKTKKIELYE